MGWCFYRARNYKNGRVDRKKECEDLIGNELVKGTLVGSTYYAAVKGKDCIYGLVVLTAEEKGDFGYKDMSDDMGPYKYGCPVGILKLLSPTDNKCANEWRRKCIEYHEREREFNRLPVGTQIAVLGNFSEGCEIVLTKVHESGRTAWQDGCGYLSQSHIKELGYRVVPEDYSKKRYEVKCLIRKYAWTDKPYRNAYLNVAALRKARYGLSDMWFTETVREVVR